MVARQPYFRMFIFYGDFFLKVYADINGCTQVFLKEFFGSIILILSMFIWSINW